MNKQESELTTNQRKALVCLLGSSTIAEAARIAGLTERTVYGYLRNPIFKRELRSRQDRAIGAAVAALSGLAGEAISCLRNILNDKKATHAVKARVALGILDQRRKSAELDDLVVRLAALEQKVK